jgi:hypothetical protein
MSDNPVREPDYDLDDTQPIVGLPLPYRADCDCE